MNLKTPLTGLIHLCCSRLMILAPVFIVTVAAIPVHASITLPKRPSMSGSAGAASPKATPAPAPFIELDGVTLGKDALDNGCTSATLTTGTLDECRYRVGFTLLRSLWLADEAQRRNLNPDAATMERLQREYEQSNVGSDLNFEVLPRIKFQRQAIELYRNRRAEDTSYTFSMLWQEVSTTASQVQIPERSLRALINTYGEDEQRFLDFQKMFPDDHESALTRTRNNWEREARRVALEKALCPDDTLTTAELERARAEWSRELETAPEATRAMLQQRKRDYRINRHVADRIRDEGKFEDGDFKAGLLTYIAEKVTGPDKAIFGE